MGSSNIMLLLKKPTDATHVPSAGLKTFIYLVFQLTPRGRGGSRQKGLMGCGAVTVLGSNGIRRSHIIKGFLGRKLGGPR